MKIGRNTGGIAFKGLVLVLALALLSVGCGPGQVLGNLQLSLDAIEAAFPLIAAAANVPADVQAQIVGYLDSTNQALGEASLILGRQESDAAKAGQIAAAFASIAVPAVPAKYQALANIVATVAKDVAAFLGSLPITQAVRPAARPNNTQSVDTQAAQGRQITTAQRLSLLKAQETYKSNAAKLDKIKR